MYIREDFEWHYILLTLLCPERDTWERNGDHAFGPVSSSHVVNERAAIDSNFKHYLLHFEVAPGILFQLIQCL